MSSKPT